MSGNTTANFDSTDWIEDAIEILDKSDFQYVILTGLNAKQTRSDSNLDPSEENEEEMVSALRNHFKIAREEQE